MLKMVFQGVQNIIIATFLKKLLFKKIVIHFIGNAIMVLHMKFHILKIEIGNLQWIIAGWFSIIFI